MADQSTDDLVNQLLTQTTVAPSPSILGVSAPPAQGQLQSLLAKLKQQQFLQQQSQPTPGAYGFLHDAGKPQFAQAGQMLGNMLQQPGGLSGQPPPAAQQQQPPFSVTPPTPGPAMDGTTAAGPAPNITPTPGATPQQSISNAVLAAKAYHAALIQQGTPADQAQVQTLSKMEQWGVPGASDKLAAAQEQLLKNNKETAEAGKDTAQGNAATDEISSRAVDQANRSRERDQADTRLDIEQQNADTEKGKLALAASRGNIDLQANPPTPGESLIAKKMADGDMAIPNVSARNPAGARLAALAFQMNPDLTQELYATRQAAYKAIGPGKAGDQVRSFNVAYSHLDTAQDAFDALKNGDYQKANALANRIATETGQPAPTNADTTLAMIKGELAKGIIGSHAGEEDRRNMLAGVNSSSAPDVLSGAAAQAKQLLLGQASGVKHQYSPQLMGNHYKFEDALSPQFKNDLDAYEAKADAKANAPKTPTAPAVQAPVTPAASSGWGPVQKVG